MTFSEQMSPEEQRKTLQAHKTLDAWETSARYWDKYRALIAQMFADQRVDRHAPCKNHQTRPLELDGFTPSSLLQGLGELLFVHGCLEKKKARPIIQPGLFG